MSLYRKLRKALRMSPSEYAHRLRHAWRQRSERREYRRGTTQTQECSEGVAPELPCRAATLLFGSTDALTGSESARMMQLRATLARRAHANAGSILAGKWRMLGHDYDLTMPIDWHRDPRTDFRWKRDFYTDLPLAGGLPDSVDVKYVWELGRQQYLVPLAEDWVLNRNEHAAQRAREILLGFVDANPLYEGVHWASPLEVAMRSISWLWTVALLADWEGWSEGDFEEIHTVLCQNAAFLADHLELYSSPYNHLIGEATALLLIESTLAHSDRSGSTLQLARNILFEHGPRQFYADGFCVEQATGYHYYTLGFLALAILVARRCGDPLSDLEPVVHRAFRTGRFFQKPDGRWPAIGDLDSARAIPIHHSDFWDFRSLTDLGSVLFDDPELKTNAPNPGPEVYWLLGEEGVASWERLSTAGRSGNRGCLLPDSGYAIATDGEDWLMFDAGPIAEGLFRDGTPSTAHGHADLLQVLYVRNGHTLLDDRGMPFYGGDPDWVRFFRSAAAHNTISIEGAPFVRSAGRLEWTHAPPSPRLAADFHESVWLAFAKASWGRGIQVERHLLCFPGKGLWIADWVALDRPRKVTWNWNLPQTPEVIWERTAGGNIALLSGDERLLIASTSYGALELTTQSPRDDSPRGWQYEEYGVRRPMLPVTITSWIDRPVVVLTSVQPGRLGVCCQLHGLRVCQDCETGDDWQEWHLDGSQWLICDTALAHVEAMSGE